LSLPPTRAFEGRFQQGTILNPGFPLPDQVEDKLRGRPWIPAGVYPGENRGRNDNMEIGFEF
jgi:hypothetical protein